MLAVRALYTSNTYGVFSAISHDISRIVASTNRHNSEHRNRKGHSSQKKMIPCKMCDAEYGSKKFCDVVAVHAGLHNPVPSQYRPIWSKVNMNRQYSMVKTQA